MRGWIAVALLATACGAGESARPDPEPPPPAPAPAPHAGGPYATAGPAPHPSACPPGTVAGVAGACVPIPAGGAASGAPSSAPPPPVPPRPPGTVLGGLARGTGDAADKALLEGDRAIEAGDAKKAKQAYTKAKRLAPKDPAAAVGLIRARLAELEVPAGYAAAPADRRVKKLLTQVDRVIASNPRYGPAHLERGRMLLIIGSAPEALAALQTAVRSIPGDPEAQSALGVALLATGKKNDALKHFKRSSELDTENADRLTNLGTAYMMVGRVSDAIKVYARAVSLAPNDARAHGDLGTAYLAGNKPQEALKHLKRAVGLAPRPRDLPLEPRLRLPAERSARPCDHDLSQGPEEGSQARLGVDQPGHRAGPGGPARRGREGVSGGSQARPVRPPGQGEPQGARRLAQEQAVIAPSP